MTSKSRNRQQRINAIPAARDHEAVTTASATVSRLREKRAQLARQLEELTSPPTNQHLRDRIGEVDRTLRVTATKIGVKNGFVMSVAADTVTPHGKDTAKKVAKKKLEIKQLLAKQREKESVKKELLTQLAANEAIARKAQHGGPEVEMLLEGEDLDRALESADKPTRIAALHKKLKLLNRAIVEGSNRVVRAKRLATREIIASDVAPKQRELVQRLDDLLRQVQEVEEESYAFERLAWAAGLKHAGLPQIHCLLRDDRGKYQQVLQWRKRVAAYLDD